MEIENYTFKSNTSLYPGNDAGDEEKTSEPYVKRYNPKAKGNKTELFKFTGKFCKKGFPIYEQIPTLGEFGMSEYNANLPQGSMQTSLLMATPTVNPIDVKNTVDNSNNNSSEISNPLTKLNKVEETAYNLGLSTKEIGLKSILEKTAVATSNPYYQLLANEMVNAVILMILLISLFQKLFLRQVDTIRIQFMII